MYVKTNRVRNKIGKNLIIETPEYKIKNLARSTKSSAYALMTIEVIKTQKAKSLVIENVNAFFRGV